VDLAQRSLSRRTATAISRAAGTRPVTWTAGWKDIPESTEKSNDERSQLAQQESPPPVTPIPSVRQTRFPAGSRYRAFLQCSERLSEAGRANLHSSGHKLLPGRCGCLISR
jgi:hypothetical protein